MPHAMPSPIPNPQSAIRNPKSEIRNPQSPHWLSRQAKFGHLAKFCDLTRVFKKLISLQITDIS
jgi:hypothetical protein